MRDDRNPDRQNRLDEQDRRNRDREIDSVEFGNDFFDDLPDRTDRIDRTDRTAARDRNLDNNNKRIK